MRWVLLAAFCYALLLLGISGGDLTRLNPVAPASSPKIDGAVLYCDPAVVRQFKAAWDASDQGQGWATPALPSSLETGFSIDYVDNHLEISPLSYGWGTPWSVTIPTNVNTVAIAHVHPINGVSHPSNIDLA